MGARMSGGGEPEVDVSGAGDEITEAEIVERIFEAVMERRLPPGTRLVESALCRAFGVGRMRIRRCLLVLASREVVELHSNRGAHVARPSVAQAREVFEARQALEPEITRLVVARASEADLDALDAFTGDEAEAQARGNRREAIRLSGQFHVRLAEAAGNATLVRMTKDLVTRSSLILGLYGAPGMGTCRDHDHRALITALRTRDPARAAQIMGAHLADIAATMDLDNPPTPAVDVAAVLAG